LQKHSPSGVIELKEVRGVSDLQGDKTFTVSSYIMVCVSCCQAAIFLLLCRCIFAGAEFYNFVYALRPGQHIRKHVYFMKLVACLPAPKSCNKQHLGSVSLATVQREPSV
jgi:hypothetical protein